MNGSLAAVRDDLRTGRVSARTLVELYAAASEAEERRDLASLEEALRLAERLAEVVDETLEPEARRLAGLCAESLDRARSAAASGAAARIACPGCGHEVSPSAVRCRACGVLLP